MSTGTPSFLPTVSVIIRTYKRPLVLAMAIESVLAQSYRNIELIVVEDGAPEAQALVESYTHRLPILYICPGKNTGRSKAGNLALEKATGDFINFLDDDDLFLPDHLSLLVNKAVAGNYDLVHAPAYCARTIVESTDPYVYRETERAPGHTVAFTKIGLYQNNLFPIQAVLFSKKLYQQYGGFDTGIEYLEDWDLWLSYCRDARVGFVNEPTSVYRVPALKKDEAARNNLLLSTREYVLNRHLPFYLIMHEVSGIEQEVSGKELLPPGNINLAIDAVSLTSEHTELQGWAMYNGNLAFDRILLRSGNRYFLFHQTSRADIAQKKGGTTSLYGFWGRIPGAGKDLALLCIGKDQYYSMPVSHHTMRMLRLKKLIKKLLPF